MAPSTYVKDGEDNIIDPPVLSDHERRIIDAQASGDDTLVHALQQKYHRERADIVGEIDRAETDEDGPDLNGNTEDADSLTRENDYRSLRNAARARGLDTTGGKIDLAGRIADHDSGGGGAVSADDPPDDDQDDPDSDDDDAPDDPNAAPAAAPAADRTASPPAQTAPTPGGTGAGPTATGGGENA